MYMVAKVNIQSKLERMLQATKAGVRPHKGGFRKFRKILEEFSLADKSLWKLDVWKR